MLTSILPVQEQPLAEPTPAKPARPSLPPGYSRKRRLLILLAAGLAALVALHLLATYVQNTILFPNTCSGLLRSADYTRTVNLQPRTQEMAAVQVVSNLDSGSPAALVQVITHDARHSLDVYIFGCAMQHRHPHLTRLFEQQGLAQGSAEITPDNTLLLAHVDTHLPADHAVLLQPFQQNVYREYSWQNGRFVQLSFSSLYPVTSRFEAQELQQVANMNKQQQPLWANPGATALQMSKDLLHWTSPQERLITETPTAAQVELSEQRPQIDLEVTLQRLIQPGNGGLWFVTGAQSAGLLLTRARAIARPFPTFETSPMHFSGVNALIDGQTTATLFDHTLTPVAKATNVLLAVQNNSCYSGTITYSNLAVGQQGVLLIESLPRPQNYDKEAGQIVLTSVILN